MNNFLIRTFTGFWIVVIILGSILLHPVSLIILGLVMVTGSLHEFYRLISKSGGMARHITGVVSGSLVYLLSVAIAMGFLKAQFFILTLIIPLYIIISQLFRNDDNPFQLVANTLAGQLLITVPLSLLPFLSFGITGLNPLIKSGEILYSPSILLGFFILLWIHDTGAYLVGATMGKRKLFERISPKKTWEGFIGGLILVVLAAWLLSGWLGLFSAFDWMVIAIIISIGGTLGDLVESMLKRSAGVKDSGRIMPGHGGFLDRFDSVLVAFPLVFVYISLFG